MAEFKISRIRYTWRSNWNTSTDYIKDDVVKYGGSTWVCIRQHTASSFKADQEFLASPSATEASPAWVRMTSGNAFRGTWNNGTLYNAGDVVAYGGYLYLSTTEHTASSVFENDEAVNWSTFLESIKWNADWNTGIDYGVGDIVKYGGIVYKCVDAHTSAGTTALGLEDNQDNWEIYFDGVEFVGTWAAGTRYKKNDLVQHNGYLWRANQGHTAAEDSTINFDSAEFWDIELPGYEYNGDWTDDQQYTKGDVVTYGGLLYESLSDNYNVRPYAEFSNPDWRVLSEGANFRGIWNAITEYNTGDVVKRGGILYKAVSDVITDGSTLDYLDGGDWEIVISSQKFVGNWTSGNVYQINDVIVYDGSTWICTFAHTAQILNSPGDNGEGIDYWDLLIQAPSDVGMTNTGDLLTYGLTREQFGDGSTLGSTNVPIGTQGQFASIDTDNTVYYDDFAEVDRVFYVSSEGIDDATNPRRGRSAYYPFNTVRFAAEQADDGFTGTTTIRVNTGTFAEVLPIIIPARTVVLGSELRSTTISPNQPRTDLSTNDDYLYMQAGLTRISQLIQDIIAGRELDPVKTPSNALDPVVVQDVLAEDVTEFTVTVATGTLYNSDASGNVFYFNGTENPPLQLVRGRTYTFIQEDTSNTTHPLNITNTLIEPLTAYTSGVTITGTAGIGRTLTFEVPQEAPDQLYYYCETHGAEMGNSITIVDQYATLPIDTGTQAALDIQQLIQNSNNYIEFYLASGDTDPAVVGTNTAIDNDQYDNAVRVLNANKEFIKAEVIAYLQNTFPAYTIDTTLYNKQIDRFIDAFAYDIVYTGNYKTLLEARYYRNEVLGSLTEDMFYCRDTTGVRDCTLSGLTGALNPPGVFDLFQRPTGGAYCSLDPGWGPADDRTWIVNRSPYIQGVTTIGTGCIGQKIDGNLHNGGNRSMVSNDFTQVLSDGIGAWVLNNARAELVSVFCYYNQVGYLAENGGIIRATNGNCSYGNFGVIADSVDPDETPLDGAVLTTNNEAQISRTLSGGTQDEILAVEYDNAGQNYTSAIGEIVGAGVNAVPLFEEFRDNAVFDLRLLDANSDRNIDSIGGGGYTIVQNTAQAELSPGNDATSIRLSANTGTLKADLLGKRIFIESGPGTGQYGYIFDYNAGTKVVDVYRESDDTPGWDHVVPGFDLATFDNSTVYRIEPRLTISAPEFSATEQDLVTATTWSAIAYGETSATYNNVTGDLGTGDVVEFDGLEATAATFDIVRNGREYTVTLDNAGLGYAVGDVITLEGTNFGGTSPYNDIVITVTEVTDDSSNSIVDFTARGTGVSGRFVATSEAGTAFTYSSDGETWVTSNLPASGDWTNIAAGGGVFVAIQSDDGTNGASSIAASSTDGVTWTQRSMPSQQKWSGVTYGNGVFVAVAEDDDAGAYSTDGITWTATTLPDFGDSSFNNWVDITYGKNHFLAIANSNNVVAEGVYSAGSGITWSAHLMDVTADSSQVDWVSVAYGSGRYVALSSEGFVTHSFNGIDWKDANQMPTQDGSTQHVWYQIRYGNGQFFAVGESGSRIVGSDPTTGPSTFAATSPDGSTWTGIDVAVEAIYKDLAFGNPYKDAEDSSVGINTPMWLLPGYNTDKAVLVRTGRRAIGRATVSSGLISTVFLYDPGSGYIEQPTVTFTDPTKTSDALVEARIADGVLGQPVFTNTGQGYRTDSTEFTITGDGFADILPSGNFVTLTGLSRIPEVGSQITFNGVSTLFNIATITELEGLEFPAEDNTITIRITPSIRTQDNIENAQSIEIREQIAQCRITGHDFLDIGTGNFEETNYPALYQDYDFVTIPANEVLEETGGRVFYTSTDQDGNFRTGELFAVEQSTGIVTISSDFFNLDGLSELRLGGIRVGGSGTVIREFSTDPTLQADSNNVVPTQRAIATFLSSRLSLGGTSIEVNALQAGVVTVGPDGFGHTAGISGTVVFPNRTDFVGPNAGVSGHLLAQTMFYASFNEDND